MTIQEHDFQEFAAGLASATDLGWSPEQLAEARRREREMNQAEGDRLTDVQIAALRQHGEWRRAHPVSDEVGDED